MCMRMYLYLTRWGKCALLAGAQSELRGAVLRVNEQGLFRIHHSLDTDRIRVPSHHQQPAPRLDTFLVPQS